MIIGTVRAEEAKALSSYAGYHQFEDSVGEPHGSFEVFWDDADVPPWGGSPRNWDADGQPVAPGWYWWCCFPGCLPDGEAHGPYASSGQAHSAALDIEA